MKVDKDNGKYVRMVKGRALKFERGPSNAFLKNIDYLV